MTGSPRRHNRCGPMRACGEKQRATGARRSAINGRSNQRRFFRTEKRSVRRHFTLMAEAEKRRGRFCQAEFRVRIQSQRANVEATTVMVVGTQRAIISIMMMAVLLRHIVFTAVGDFVRTHGQVTPVGRQGAKVQSGEHAENHQPCEKGSHQRSGHLLRMIRNSRKNPPPIF